MIPSEVPPLANNSGQQTPRKRWFRSSAQSRGAVDSTMKGYSRLVIAFIALVVSANVRADDLRKRTLPTLAIKEAIDLAEDYLNKMDEAPIQSRIKAKVREGKFLTRVDYHDTGPFTELRKSRHVGGYWQNTSGPYWQVTYEPEIHADGGQIFVSVYMNRMVTVDFGR